MIQTALVASESTTVLFLLEIVKNPFVYKACCSEITRADVKEAVWRHLSAKFHLSVDECKRTWGKIRNQFVSCVDLEGSRLKYSPSPVGASSDSDVLFVPHTPPTSPPPLTSNATSGASSYSSSRERTPSPRERTPSPPARSSSPPAPSAVLPTSSSANRDRSTPLPSTSSTPSLNTVSEQTPTLESRPLTRPATPWPRRSSETASLPSPYTVLESPVPLPEVRSEQSLYSPSQSVRVLSPMPPEMEPLPLTQQPMVPRTPSVISRTSSTNSPVRPRRRRNSEQNKRGRTEINQDLEQQPKKMFLLSLLPDIENMTDRQTRKFKARVSQLVTDILEEAE